MSAQGHFKRYSRSRWPFKNFSSLSLKKTVVCISSAPPPNRLRRFSASWDRRRRPMEKNKVVEDIRQEGTDLIRKASRLVTHKAA